MGIVSGGGGSGNTTAQVVASGKVLPVADATGVTVDTTTYNNSIAGSGKLTTLVFPAETASLAIAETGDAFPRYIFGSESVDGISMGNGTVDPYTSGSSISAHSGGNLNVVSQNAALTLGQGAFGNYAAGVSKFDKALQINSAVTLNSGSGVPGMGGSVGDLYIRTGSGTLILYRCTVAGTAGNATWLPVLTPGSPVGIITSGALSTVQLVSATPAQILTTSDAETITPCTFNPGAATTATVTVALSPDNVTYSTLGVETEPAGVAFDGTIHLVKVRVPAGWYLKLTVNAQAVLGLTTYY